MQINAYQERTKINTEVNERPLKKKLVCTGIQGTTDFNEYQFFHPSPKVPTTDIVSNMINDQLRCYG